MNKQGKVLIWRDYRGDVRLGAAERFMDILMASEDAEAKPIFVEDGITYVSVSHSNLIRTVHLLLLLGSRSFRFIFSAPLNHPTAHLQQPTHAQFWR